MRTVCVGNYNNIRICNVLDDLCKSCTNWTHKGGIVPIRPHLLTRKVLTRCGLNLVLEVYNEKCQTKLTLASTSTTECKMSKIIVELRPLIWLDADYPYKFKKVNIILWIKELILKISINQYFILMMINDTVHPVFLSFVHKKGKNRGNLLEKAPSSCLVSIIGE